MDFTIKKYTELLKALVDNGYEFQTFKDFLAHPRKRVIILRHDVDDLPENSLTFAKIQSDFGVLGTYYFRTVPQSWDEEIILEIANLGHEIGYHYETLDNSKGDISLGFDIFKKDLISLRKLVEVETICMHGSPRSKFDNKDLWKEYDYKTLGLIGEPYFDVDFNKIFYCTDTGRRWDGHKVSVRDKVESRFEFEFHSTDDLIESVNNSTFPNQAMLTFHPQRWNDDYVLWGKELVLQSIKNIVKKYFFVK